VVELIVVIAILATLAGLILPALSGARKRSAKSAEMNNLKQLGHAWMLYANANQDAALPGYLDTKVQQDPVPGVSRGWGVTYKFPDRSAIPINALNLAGPWVWRLASYFDFNHPLVHAHLDEPNPDVFSMVKEGKLVAYEPAFGYNGFYLGGWWDMLNLGGVQTPRFKFFDHCSVDPPPTRPLRIPLGVGQITRPSDMVTFCSSHVFASAGVQRSLASNTSGWHMVMPPTMADTPRWRPAPGDSRTLEVLAPGTWAPIGRYTGGVATLSADGHVSEESHQSLFDQRKWIDNAETAAMTHGPCTTP
jgi:hypothetical protein